MSGILYLHFLDLETPLDENLRYELDSVRNQIYTTSDRLWSDLMNSWKLIKSFPIQELDFNLKNKLSHETFDK